MPAAKEEKLSSNSETEAAYKARMDEFISDMTGVAASAIPVEDACKELHAYVLSKEGTDPMASDKGTWAVAKKKGGGCLIA
ncbi:hypothetical protein AB1Y20_021489 [Prymnesium parvum]|uniref:G protein gamma domain-containing protein n=1 Tax=Prymnesium parvum TaxID=97485 RepID=A0AB34JJP4_PRYPA